MKKSTVLFDKKTSIMDDNGSKQVGKPIDNGIMCMGFRDGQKR